jgi:hypothetical protein
MELSMLAPTTRPSKDLPGLSLAVGRPSQTASLALDSVVQSHKAIANGAAVTRLRVQTWTEVVNTSWASAKMLNEKLMENTTANADAALVAAQAIASAATLPEATRLQNDFLRQLFAEQEKQANDFLDLSSRAAQHMLEVLHCAASNSMSRDA